MSDLVKLFRELTRSQTELAYNYEHATFTLLDMISQIRSKWEAAEKENAKLNRSTATFKNDLENVRNENKELKRELIQCRSQIVALIAAKTEFQRENESLVNQVSKAQSVLRGGINVNEFGFLNNNLPQEAPPSNQSGFHAGNNLKDDGPGRVQAIGRVQKNAAPSKRSISVSSLAPSDAALVEHGPRERFKGPQTEIKPRSAVDNGMRANKTLFYPVLTFAHSSQPATSVNLTVAAATVSKASAGNNNLDKGFLAKTPKKYSKTENYCKPPWK